MTEMLTKAWGGPTTWGDSLLLKIHRSPKAGLNPYVDAIHAVMGKHIGSRPTFANLFAISEPADLNETYAWRAWLLLTVLGENPEDWGISENVVPPAVNVRHLRKALKDVVRHQGLEPRTRWFEVSDNFTSDEALVA